MSDTSYPDYPPPIPAFIPQKTATVAGREPETFYTVDLSTMECSCQHGKAWRWNNRRWVAAAMCSHKLKCIASLVEHSDDNNRLYDYYENELGRRYNAFIAVSAMHKELRRGDAEQALYWATIMIPHRGRHGVIRYMLNIMFEETRDLNLFKFILRLASMGKAVSHLDMQRGIRRFCAAPKKWELPWRKEIFLNEMRGYKKLAEKYGYDVAKPKDIIPFTQQAELQRTLLTGYDAGDPVMVQYGLKGWFKSVSTNAALGDRAHEDMKVQIFNLLTDILNGDRPNGFPLNEDYAHRLHALLIERLRDHNSLGYHELNVLADALCGENEADPRCTLPVHRHKLLTAHPNVYRVPLSDGLKVVPRYAHDNHTWPGKAKMRQYGAVELRPGADQRNIDFRLCGAYMGVAWRTLAYAQHGTIDVPWSSVSWAGKSAPNWLWTHLDNMWY